MTLFQMRVERLVRAHRMADMPWLRVPSRGAMRKAQKVAFARMMAEGF